MSFELFKKCAIKLTYGESHRGSGVIFKPSKNSKTIYIVTAKHVFFGENNAFKSCADRFLETKDILIQILFEFITPEVLEIKLKNDRFYFLRNKDIDLAFGVLNINQYSGINPELIVPLEILDCENCILERLNYFALGYPESGLGNSNVSQMSGFHLKYLNEEEGYLSTKFLSKNPSSFNNRAMLGFSGAGIFVKQKEGLGCLSHIQFLALDGHFHCTRLDQFLDEINQLIATFLPNEDLIELQAYIVFDNERLNFTEYGSLDFFKEKIKQELPAYLQEMKRIFSENDETLKEINIICKNAVGDESLLVDEELTRSVIPKLREKYNEINNQVKGLSYIYAYLGLVSTSSGRTRTSLFKKAISLNPEHQQTFLLQKQKLAGNTDAMKKTAENSLSGTIALYDQLIAVEENDLVKIRVIEEGMRKIYDFNSKNDNDLREESLKRYFEQLENTLRQSNLIRDFYKYISLGEICCNYLNKNDKALYFYQVATQILEKSLKNENDHAILEKLKSESSRLMEENSISLSEALYQQAIKEADAVLAKQEDKELKTSVTEVKQMMFAIQEELKNIKNQSRDHRSALEYLERQLSEISTDQFQKDQIIDFNLCEANKHIELLGNSTKAIKDYIDSVPRNYDLALNNNFKQDISYLIKDQVDRNLSDLIVPLIESVAKDSKNLSDNIHDFVKNAEKSLETITALKKQEIKNSEEQLRQLTITFNKDAMDKIDSFKAEAKNLNDSIAEKIGALVRAQNFSNEEKQLIMETLETAKYFFDDSAKTIYLKAGATDMDLGNSIRIMAGDLSGLVETQNRNFISLAKALLREDKKENLEVSIKPLTTSPESTAIELGDVPEDIGAKPSTLTQKTSDKQKPIVRFLKLSLLWIVLILIIYGVILVSDGR